MLKYVKLFESYLNEATIQVMATKNVKLGKGIEEEITLAQKLSEELQEMAEDFKKKFEPMKATLDKYDADIMEKLNSLNINAVKVGKITAKLQKKKGKLTDSYKTLWEKALDKVNEATKKVLMEIQTANKKQNPDSEWMEYEKETNEGLKEIKDLGEKFLSKIKKWTSSVWNKLKGSIDNHEEAVNDLEKLSLKPIPLKESLMINESSNPNIDKLDIWFKKLVSSSGKCKTKEGEMVRAMMKICYRYFNDGDFFWRGYGIETAGPAAYFLMKYGTPEISSIIKEADGVGNSGASQYGAKDKYLILLDKASKALCEYIESKKEKYEPNSIDMLDFYDEAKNKWKHNLV